MAGRVQGLIENLEHSVQARTQELTMARDELQDAVRSLDEKNRMLEILSRTDRLTSIANRRRLEEALQAEILRARRYETPFTVIMLDIDHFKDVNDTYGHQVGIGSGRRGGEAVAQRRETDIVGRWGGEEFLLICPETSQPVGVDIAERLRRDYCEAIMPGVGHVTSSFGVATFQRNDDTGTLLQRVDEALYLAKSNGRNRVEQL
jgi:diguanylate cyclase (GGDEF) domain